MTNNLKTELEVIKFTYPFKTKNNVEIFFTDLVRDGKRFKLYYYTDTYQLYGPDDREIERKTSWLFRYLIKRRYAIIEGIKILRTKDGNVIPIMVVVKGDFVEITIQTDEY